MGDDWDEAVGRMAGDEGERVGALLRPASRELADFHPSTGHLHSCMRTTHREECDSQCAEHLYAIAQDAERASSLIDPEERMLYAIAVAVSRAELDEQLERMTERIRSFVAEHQLEQGAVDLAAERVRRVVPLRDVKPW